MFKLFKAFFIMLRAHSGQKDKAGKCYIFHPINVALGVNGVRATTVALFNFLDKEQMDAILLLTHNTDEEYFDYINRVKTNKIALAVKLSDLRHNSNLKRLKTITEKDINRRNKYLKAMEILENYKQL